jgi:hypothetical protein
MKGNTTTYTDEQMLNFIIRDIKKVGLIPSANHNHKLKLTPKEIEQVSKATSIAAHKIYMFYG